MKFLKLSFSLFFIAISSVCVAKERPPLVLKPISKWNAEWAENSCRLQRVYGDAQQPFLLRMIRYDAQDLLEFVISGDALKNIYGEKFRIAFGDGEPMVVDAQRGKMPDGSPSLIFSSVIGPNTKDERTSSTDENAPIKADTLFADQVSHISIIQDRARIVVETGKLAAPLAAMQSCMDDLLTSWDLDPKVQRNLTKLAGPKTWKAMAQAIGVPVSSYRVIRTLYRTY